MSFPKPETGLVIRYSYLWASEARRGQEEGVKDRPCAVVLASQTEPDGKIRVTVAPITHTPPEKGVAAIEVPPKVGQHLGFDDTKSWIVTSEVNRFTWLGPDVRPANKRNYVFGQLPAKLIMAVRDGIVEQKLAQSKIVERDEAKPAESRTAQRTETRRTEPAAKDWTQNVPRSTARHSSPGQSNDDENEQ